MNRNLKKKASAKHRTKKITIRSVKAHYRWILCAVVLTFIAYLPVLNNDFLNWDDPIYVTQNSFVKSEWSADRLKSILVEPVGGNHHPVTMFSLALDYSLFGNNPTAFHAVQLCLHLLSVVLLFLFVFLFTRGNPIIAFLVALLFGIHPMHVESVAWISERKDVLYGLFFFAGLITYLQYLFTKKTSFYYATLVLFVLSVFSKPAAVVFPIVLILIDMYLYKKWHPKMLVNKIAFLVISVGVGLLTIQAQSDANAFTEIGTYFNRILFASYGFNTYLAKLFVPVRLSALYPYPLEMHLKQTLPFVFLVSPVITLLIVGLTLYSVKYFKKVVLFGVAFYTVTLALVLQLVSVGFALMADRYTYLPYVGIFFVMAWLYDRYVVGDKLKSWVTWVLAVYIAALGVLTWQQTKIWRSGDVLWTDVLKKFPEANPVAYFARANHYFGHEEFENAIEDYSEAIEMSPRHFQAFTNRGKAYEELGQNDQAMENYNKALKANPIYLDALVHRGNLYLNMGQPEKVLADARKILRQEPNHANALNLVAGAYFQQKKYDLGLQEVNKALQIMPEYSDALLNRAIIYSVKKNHQAALQDYNDYLELKPKDIRAYLWRGITLQNLQKYQAAIADFSTVIEEQPQNGEAYRNRSFAYGKLGQTEKAAKDDLKAKELGY